MHYYVVTGGPLTSKAAEVIKDGLVIAADKGIDFCFEHGFKPEFDVTMVSDREVCFRQFGWRSISTLDDEQARRVLRDLLEYYNYCRFYA